MTRPPHKLNLLGIDVGYSKSRASTGIARCGPCGFESGTATADWKSRKCLIDCNYQFDLAAIDGPLLPQETTHQQYRRECEFHFIRAPFHNRCKPGLSHSGQGYDLRIAANATFNNLVEADILKIGSFEGPWIAKGLPIVEAFPNGFLGVLLPDGMYGKAPRLKRGKRFDWLYDHAHQKIGEMDSSVGATTSFDVNLRLRGITRSELR